MNKRKKMLNYIVTYSLIGAMLITMCGCSSEVSNIGYAKEDTYKVSEPEYRSLVGAYDSADTAVIKQMDLENKQLNLLNIATGKSYTLQFNGTTSITDKYGSPMTAAQLKQGQIIDITFLKSNRTLNSVQLSESAWEYNAVDRYDLGGANHTATVGSATYNLDPSVQVFSEGRYADVMEVVKGDVISVAGVGHSIYSIQVESGHGYIRLTNDIGLIGGWIEIGNKVITKVSSENMLLTVPEGTYTVKMYNDHSSMTRDVLVERNQEVVLDCSEITVEETNVGYVKFDINPPEATLLIDGNPQEINTMLELTYGIHNIEVAADGYETMSKFISVGTEVATIRITLEPEKEKKENSEEEEGEENGEYKSSVSDNIVTDDTMIEGKPNQKTKNPLEAEFIDSMNKVSGNSVSGNSVSGNTTTLVPQSGKKVYIDSPYEAEVYVDGIYVGLAPISFAKTPGSHTITFRKVGYSSRSYTIYLYNDNQDITYSFSELVKLVDETSGNSNSNSTKPSESNNTESGKVEEDKKQESPKDTDVDASEETEKEEMQGTDSEGTISDSHNGNVDSDSNDKTHELDKDNSGNTSTNNANDENNSAKDSASDILQNSQENMSTSKETKNAESLDSP